MERFIYQDQRLSLAQRRAMRTLMVENADQMPKASMEKYLGGLKVLIREKDGTLNNMEEGSRWMTKEKLITKTPVRLTDRLFTLQSVE